jgi:MFS family permease
MFPSMLMPLISTMSRVALPIIRDEFQLQADVTAWVSAAFTLPFMLLMPVYGRLSDGVDPRRLILMGTVIYAAGTILVMSSTSVASVMFGNAILGLGVAGMMPLGMSLVSSLFSERERGRALGTWSQIGPTTGFVGPFIAGFCAAAWGWRSTYAPPLLLAIVAFVVIWVRVASRERVSGQTRAYLKAFDWGGFALLSVSLSSFVFFLSSRAITGVAPMRDWRLLGISIVFFASFWLWERRRISPFVSTYILTNTRFLTSSFVASTRMAAMGGLTLLIPLYLVDIHQLEPQQLGAMLVLNSGAMALVTRFAGDLADRLGTRWPASIGLVIQIAVMLIFWTFTAETSLWIVGSTLAFHGIGAGLLLASLHRYVMSTVDDSHRGAAAGVYSMLRFVGAVIGTSLSGVILQSHLDAGMDLVRAYQETFVLLAVFPVAGILVAQVLKEKPVSA